MDKTKSRKVDEQLENPIDNLLLKINQKLNPYYKKLNFTPNILTILSFITTIIGIFIYCFIINCSNNFTNP